MPVEFARRINCVCIAAKLAWSFFHPLLLEKGALFRLNKKPPYYSCTPDTREEYPRREDSREAGRGEAGRGEAKQIYCARTYIVPQEQREATRTKSNVLRGPRKGSLEKTGDKGGIYYYTSVPRGN